MGCLGKGLGLLLLAAWVIGGTYFLVEQKAHGEGLLLPVVILGWGLLVVAALVMLALDRVLPRRLRVKGPLGTVALLALGIGPTIVIFLLVDANVANRRPAVELTAVLAPTSAGTAVSGAGAMTTDGSAPNRLVVLDPDGKEHAWTGHPRLELRPASLADAQLVVCVDNEAEETVLEVCHYSNGPDITRYAVSRRVRVVAAATGEVLFDETVTADPRACRQTEQKEVTRLAGDLGWDQVEAELLFLIGNGAAPSDVAELTLWSRWSRASAWAA
jgi:hypothetical protein